MAAISGSWGDYDDYFEPTTQVIGPDENGIKTVIETKKNEEGKKVEITTKIQVKKITKKVSKQIAERRKWIKFGDATGKGEPGTIDENVTIPSLDEVRLESPNEPKKEASEDLIERLKEICR